MDTTKKLTCEEGFIQACKELNINHTKLPIVISLPKKLRKSIIAFYKLTIITEALNFGWKVDYFNHKQVRFWNNLWIDPLGAPHMYSDSTFEHSGAGVCLGSQLCFKDEKTANYAINNFQKLYEEYLLIK